MKYQAHYSANGGKSKLETPLESNNLSKLEREIVMLAESKRKEGCACVWDVYEGNTCVALGGTDKNGRRWRVDESDIHLIVPEKQNH